MNLPDTKGLRNSSRRWRAVRAFTAFALITFLFTASSVQADPVRINQVVQTLSTSKGPAELKLSTAIQDPVSGPKKGSTPAGGPRSDVPTGSQVSGNGANVEGLFPGVQDPQQLGVEIIEEAEVEGTICDCGAIFIPGGAFPKWPLLFLGAVPLFFINDSDEPPISVSTPTPPPPTTQTPVPEPASLLLFATSLLAAGAGLRRRRSKAKLAQQAKAKEEE